MFAKLDTFEERGNKFFNEMLKDLNPLIYKIRRDRFVFQEQQSRLYGRVAPSAHVSVFINGVLAGEVDALGDGSFSLYIRLVNDENVITVSYI
jgi:hypothetical protein